MAEQKFDVFLCHNSEDKPAVIEIAQQLRQNDLKPWLDVWALKPGDIWQFTLEQQIERIGAAAVFVGKKGLGPWQSQEIYAFLQEFIRRECPVIPVMLSDAPKQPNLPIFLRTRHWVDFRLRQPDPLNQLIWGVTGQKPEEVLKTAETISIQAIATDSSPSPAIQDEISALHQEVASFRARQQPVSDILSSTPPSPTPVDELTSEKGVDYTRLRNLLKAKDWKAADQETGDRMCEAMNRQKEGWLRVEDIKNFPCQDLRTIDQLWVKYSNGRFGFSVQKKIWQACGSPTEYNKDWEKFGATVGWRTKGVLGMGAEWVSYSELTFDLGAPRGHLPDVGGWLEEIFSSLASRLVKCNL